MATTRILWSGLTGRTGREAVEQVKKIDGVEIVAGISRLSGRTASIAEGRADADGIWTTRSFDFKNVQKWYLYKDIANPLKGLPKDFDVLADFSNAEVFDQVVECAVRTEKPLIVGTSGLSDGQIASLYDATNRIPVFKGGNFRFKVKKFIDEAVELAMATPGNLTLYENFYEGKSLPSETSKVIQKRISDATGKAIGVHSSATLDKTNLPCDWKIGDLHCHTVGFDELAHDVLEIAKVMAKKPIKRGEFYDLDEIWDDIPEAAKPE